MQKSIVSLLKAQIGDTKVLVGSALENRYDHIWNMAKPLSAKAVLLPTSTQDVSDILKICHEHNQPIVVHGGLTGLVGGTAVDPETIVISTEKLNQIEALDENSRTITVQSGVVLENIHEAVSEKGLMFPIDFGAKGSAQIGGVIATNAGGLRVFRYGMTRSLVLGLEAVLTDGTIISSLKKIIKDNSGYDLKQLFIGTEGTLGIITKAVLKLVEAPQSRTSVFIGIDGYDKVVQLLRFLDAALAGTLSSFELIWADTYQALTNEHASVKPPLPYGYEYYVLVDVLGSNSEKDEERLINLIEQAFEEERILDAVFAKNKSDLDWFWTVREDVHTILKQIKYSQNFDISIPTAMIGEVVSKMLDQLEAVEGVETVFPFGHIADGNVHFIVGKKDEGELLTHQINQVIYLPLLQMGGSISAEHGIGIEKKKYLEYSRSEDEINLMKILKKSLDPKNILNPGKIIDLDP